MILGALFILMNPIFNHLAVIESVATALIDRRLALIDIALVVLGLMAGMGCYYPSPTCQNNACQTEEAPVNNGLPTWSATKLRVSYETS